MRMPKTSISSTLAQANTAPNCRECDPSTNPISQAHTTAQMMSTFLVDICSLDGPAGELAGERVSYKALGQMYQTATSATVLCLLHIYVFILRGLMAPPLLCLWRFIVYCLCVLNPEPCSTDSAYCSLSDSRHCVS